MRANPPLAKSLSLFFYLAVFAVSGCSQSTTKNHATQTPRQPELWPALSPAFAESETEQLIEDKIDVLLKQMTVAQKVGQITQAEFTRITPEQVRDYHIGSVLNGGGAFLNGDKHASVDDWVAALDRYYEASMDTSSGGLPIPIIWGTDAVHGHNKIVGATIFPHNIGLGATRNGELVREIAAITAQQVRATGMDWTFSPALSVVRNDRWGRTYEGFSEDPALVAELGRQAVLGYQGDLSKSGTINSNHIAATAKHYLADGGTVDGIDRGNNFDDEIDLIRLHAYPYFDAIEVGVLSVMASHSSWQGVRLHGERYLLTDILKERLGFDGLVVGDWNSHGLVDGCTNTRCPAAINAGVDLLMVPFEWQAFIRNTIEDVESGAIPRARLNDAVRRILRVKYRTGLMDGVKPSLREHAGDESKLNNPQFRAVARQAVRESLVLLKNNHRTLPLSPTQKVLVAGPAAHNIPQQNGGWTLSWQATDTNNEDFPEATSVYQGIKKRVEHYGGQVELAINGRYRVKPDVAIVVFGEPPYAEWQGDTRHMGYQAGSHTDAKLLEQLQAQGIPTVSIFISGRPMWVNRELNASDAFVAAWLPGTEADGIAEVLFTDADGQIQFDFTGILPVSWPRTIEQAELNIGDADYDPLFAFGYGLNYNKARYLPKLPTNESFVFQASQLGTPLFVAKPQAPWQVYATDEQGQSVRYFSGIASAGGLTITEGDQNTQGDALLGSWSGEQFGALQINNPNANRNFTQLLEDDGALLFDMKLLKPASDSVAVQLACRGAACKASIDFTDQMQQTPLAQWQSQSIALRCFAQRGLTFNEVTRAFSIQTSGTLEVALANIRIEPGAAEQASVACSP